VLNGFVLGSGFILSILDKKNDILTPNFKQFWMTTLLLIFYWTTTKEREKNIERK